MISVGSGRVSRTNGRRYWPARDRDDRPEPMRDAPALVNGRGAGREIDEARGARPELARGGMPVLDRWCCGSQATS